VTVETTGTMLLGSEIGAALTALEPLGLDLIGLNCATGPAEMSEHLRHLARHSRTALACHAQRRPAPCWAATGRTTR
jgi:5-methyltetrahydrofolate--homocysteine methyltransferase